VATGSVLELRSELGQAVRRTSSIYEKMTRARSETLPKIGKNDDTALMIAGYLETHYTALETFFVRVAQHFENNLRQPRWHSDLLDKMCLRIEGLREYVIAESTVAGLRELLRFRHFRRYYVEMDYDWHRMDFLLGVIDRLHPRILEDLTRFETFLDALAAETEI